MVWQLLTHLLQAPPTAPILWNVNIPAVPQDLLQGCKITRLGRRHHAQSIVPARNPDKAHAAIGGWRGVLESVLPGLAFVLLFRRLGLGATLGYLLARLYDHILGGQNRTQTDGTGKIALPRK